MKCNRPLPEHWSRCGQVPESVGHSICRGSVLKVYARSSVDSYFKTIYITFRIVTSPSKIRDRDWSYTRHVICTNNQCCSMQQQPGEQDSCSRAILHNFGAYFFSVDLGASQYLCNHIYNISHKNSDRFVELS